MSTALTVYLANAASAKVATANQLYNGNAGSPATNQTVTTMGTVTGFGEMLPRGGTAWAASPTIGDPTGNGFVLDANTLDGQQILSGSWSATLRLVAMQSGSQAGSMVADIHVRAYKLSLGVYTQIIDLSAASPTINANLTNYTLSGTTTSPTIFLRQDLLYLDIWLNILTGSGSVNQGVRINRLTTDTVTFVGDTLASVTTPGYQAATNMIVISVTETATGSEQVVVQTTTQTPTAVSVTEVPTGSERVMVQAFAVASVSLTEVAVGSEQITAQALTLVATGTQETTIGKEQVIVQPITISDPDAQMTVYDMTLQYQRIQNSAAWSSIKVLASIYYGNSTNNNSIYGELDAVLKHETIHQLRVMRTINDVTAFLRAYSYATNVLSDLPIAYYRLGESSGPLAYDSAGRSFNAMINGGVAFGQSGALSSSTDTALLLDGSTGYLALPFGVNPTNWTGITLEVWVKLSTGTFTQTPRMLSCANTASDKLGFDLSLNANGAGGSCVVGNGSSSFGAVYTNTLTPLAWYHIVVTYNGTTLTLYGNGAFSGSISATGNIAAPAYAANIGRNPSTTSNYFPGYVDEIAMYNYALSAGRVLAHYNAAIHP